MSMKASINVLSQANGRKVAILGDMFELGENSKELHKEVGQAAVGKVDILVCIGNLSKDIAEAAIEADVIHCISLIKQISRKIFLHTLKKEILF